MMDTESLYTGILVESSRNTRYSGKPVNPAGYYTKTGNNPVCGDKVIWYVKLKDGIISDIRYEVSGCMISKSSTSLLAALMFNKPAGHFSACYFKLQSVINPGSAEPQKHELNQNNWLALAQIKSYPARKKCALLAWDTLNQLLDEQASN